MILMKKARIFLLSLLCFNLVCAKALAEDLPPNISIKVEFRESGRSAGVVNGLGETYQSKTSNYTEEQIVVTDGLSASIRVGQDVPFVDFYRDYLYNNGYVETKGIVYKEIGTSLKVTPKIKGDLIEIELTPEISALIDKESKVIDIKKLSTTVMAADGESISIGEFIQDKYFSGTFFKSGRSSKLDIILTPRIMR